MFLVKLLSFAGWKRVSSLKKRKIVILCAGNFKLFWGLSWNFSLLFAFWNEEGVGKFEKMDLKLIARLKLSWNCSFLEILSCIECKQQPAAAEKKPLELFLNLNKISLRKKRSLNMIKRSGFQEILVFGRSFLLSDAQRKLLWINL